MQERIINKLRINKRRLNKIYKYVIQFIDLEDGIDDTETLSVLAAISKINEELTTIIYMIIDNKKY